MNKKKIIFNSIFICIGIALIFVALFVPFVHLIARDTSQVIVYEKSVSFLQYNFDGPFFYTDALDVYFDATGPIWTATGGILMCLIVAVSGLVLTLSSIFDLALCKAKSLNVRNNVLSKKLALFIGYLTISIGVFAIVAFIVTTMLANGYVQFYISVAPCIFIALGIATVVLAHLYGKREQEQNNDKVKNSIGFGLSALFALVSFVFVFLPQYSQDYFGADVRSFFSLSQQASELSIDPYIANTVGDIPIGFVQWGIIALGIATAFMFIYGLIGFIFTLLGKKTNWLSSRIKRWSMAFLITYSVIYFLVLCSAGVLLSTLTLSYDQIYVFMPIAYLLMFIPYLPYVFSTMVSVNKKKKEVETK